MATKKFSPAQIAAQKLFAERARAGTLNQRKKRKPNPGLYENINAKRKRIAARSGEKMRKPGQAGRPTAEAFEQSAMTAKRNPIEKMKIEGSQTPDNPQGMIVTEAGALRFAKQNMPGDLKKAGFVASVFPGARGWVINYGKSVGNRKTNPDKDEPNKYVKRASQITGKAPSSRLLKRRTKALFAPEGYFPNPKAAPMMTAYQVICMHPKKHVVGIFKTMAEAKMVARAMADAKGVAYGVKAVKVHKAHFAV